MTNTVDIIRSDPATYRLIEVLFGKAKDINDAEVSLSVPWSVYLYAAGDNLCSATPDDYAPSNAIITYMSATYKGSGTIEGSFIADVERHITEVGIILFTENTKILIAKACLSQPVRVTPGQEFTLRFTFLLS